jgi:hypothetical protein
MTSSLMFPDRGCFYFLQENFGRQSPEPRAMTKIPFSLFRDFKANGSVEFILKAVVSFMKENGWNSFDISGPERRLFGHSILKQLEIILIKVSCGRRIPFKAFCLFCWYRHDSYSDQ